MLHVNVLWCWRLVFLLWCWCLVFICFGAGAWCFYVVLVALVLCWFGARRPPAVTSCSPGCSTCPTRPVLRSAPSTLLTYSLKGLQRGTFFIICGLGVVGCGWVRVAGPSRWWRRHQQRRTAPCPTDLSRLVPIKLMSPFLRHLVAKGSL